MNLELFHRTDFSDITDQLSMKEIRRILQLRKAYTKDLIEKSEFIQLLKKTTPSPSLGKWSPKWKAVYISAELDSKRTLITKDELCNITWNFRFKQWPPEASSMMARFLPDYSYISDLINGQMRWRFYAGQIQVEQYPPTSSKSWQMFTLSIASRTENWGWIIQNEHVIYTQASHLENI